MLRFKVNGRDSEISYKMLNVSELTYTDDKREVINVNCPKHEMLDNDVVRFTRESDSGDFNEMVNVTIVDQDNFTINAFPNYKIIYSAITLESIATGFDDYGNVVSRPAFVVYLDGDNQIATTHAFSEIDAVIYNEYYDGTEDGAYKCVGDYVYYNGLVYQIGENGIGSDGKYHFSNNPSESSNYKNVELTYFNRARQKYLTVSGGVILVNEQGEDDTSKIYFFYEDGRRDKELIDRTDEYALLSYMMVNSPDIEITSRDNRFYDINGNGNLDFIYDDRGVQLSYIEREMGSYRLSLPISETFSTKASLDYAHENLLNEVAEENIKPAIDYEKRIFEPVRYEYGSGTDQVNFKDNNFSEISEIVFNLHFRERHDYPEEDKEWVSDDTDIWNGYYTKKDGDKYTVLVRESGLTDSDADNLLNLHFTDGDVYFQRNKLRKSFLRLLFYDSPDRRNQVLQFYSTVFYDSGDAFTKYVAARSIQDRESYYGISEDETTYVSNEHLRDGRKDLRLCASFSVKDKNDMLHCSDGFYVYMFPSVLEGTLPTDMYLKVEFNHAKYGRTIPFTLPSYKDGNKILPLNPSKASIVGSNKYYFPVHYMNYNDVTEQYSEVDYQRALNDMYIKVKVKYDDSKNRYVWFLPRPKQTFEETGQIVFNLFEPRLNGYEKLPEDTRYDEIPEELPTGATVTTTLTNTTNFTMWFGLKKNGVNIITYNLPTGVNSTNPVNATTEIDIESADMNFTFCFYPNGCNRNVKVSINSVIKEGGVNKYNPIGTVIIPPATYKEFQFDTDITSLIYKDVSNKDCIMFNIAWT